MSKTCFANKRAEIFLLWQTWEKLTCGHFFYYYTNTDVISLKVLVISSKGDPLFAPPMGMISDQSFPLRVYLGRAYGEL